MSKYKVIGFNEKDSDGYSLDTYEQRADELRVDFGLLFMSRDEVLAKWNKYSDSMAAGWMMPDKESVEQVFGVKLEEIESDD